MFMISYAFYVLSPTDKTVDDFFEGVFQKHIITIRYSFIKKDIDFYTDNVLATNT